MHAYEEQHHPMPECSGVDVLRFLMEEHGLTQSDLPEVGSQGVISDILRGKRDLNIRQIRVLAKRFQVSPGGFTFRPFDTPDPGAQTSRARTSNPRVCGQRTA